MRKYKPYIIIKALLRAVRKRMLGVPVDFRVGGQQIYATAFRCENASRIPYKR
jgi:hypothetical protein